jgi:hypothetical protein
MNSNGFPFKLVSEGYSHHDYTHVLCLNTPSITTVISNGTIVHNLVHHNEITNLTP